MSMKAVPNVAGGGEPPYDNEMDRRLTMLEMRFDTTLPTLATKSDFEALWAEECGDEQVAEHPNYDVGRSAEPVIHWGQRLPVRADRNLICCNERHRY